MQIFHLDSYSRSNLIGYASVSLPTRPGIHFIQVPAWRPLGNYRHIMEWWRRNRIGIINQERLPRSWCATLSAEESNWLIASGSITVPIALSYEPSPVERSIWNSVWYSAISSDSESITKWLPTGCGRLSFWLPSVYQLPWRIPRWRCRESPRPSLRVRIPLDSLPIFLPCRPQDGRLHSSRLSPIKHRNPTKYLSFFLLKFK